MKQVNKGYLAGFLAVLTALLGGVALAKGGIYIGKHEGDTLHLLQIVLRMANGEWPHLNFHTPIGALAVAPIAGFVRAGLGVGMAFLAAQVLVAALLLPAIWYVAWSRFRGLSAYAFGAMVLILLLALVHAESDPIVSVSMHYNRWSWAIAFLVIAVAMLEAQEQTRGGDWLEGVIIGLGFAALALIKVTYLVGFAPGVLVLLISRRAWSVLAIAVLSGMAVAIGVALFAGIGFWLAYANDVMAVSGSKIRPNPGLPFAMVVGAPAYMAASVAALLPVVLLRQGGRAREGLALLLLAGGFFFVTYQNFANDPQWLGLLGLILWQVAPEEGRVNAWGWNLRQATRLTALAALVMAMPSLINLAYSPFRHALVDVAKYTPLLPGSGANEDLQTLKARAGKVVGQVALDGPGTPYAPYTDASQRDMVEVTFQGETLPICDIKISVVSWYSAMAADLRASGLEAGKTVFSADMLSAFWLYGAFEPLPGASPWYYGGLDGWENADYLIVPLCPQTGYVRKLILEDVTALGTPLREVRRNQMFILYEKT